MALYDIVSGTSAVASDVQQVVNIFNGKHDIGQINLAPILAAPSTSNFTLTAQAGNSLGVGSYNYQFTYVTGQYKSNGTTLVKTGETLPSSALSITTTSGNTTVKITLPISLPTSVVAIEIYRASVGGSDYKLITTVKAGSATYTDSTADASRGTETPPSTNSTGTTFAQGSWIGMVFQNGWTGNGGGWAPGQYRKNSLGMVELRGRVSGGTTTQGTVITTLPVGYRPDVNHSYMVLTHNGGGDTIGQIDIYISGEIQIILGGNFYLSLDDIPPFAPA